MPFVKSTHEIHFKITHFFLSFYKLCYVNQFYNLKTLLQFIIDFDINLITMCFESKKETKERLIEERRILEGVNFRRKGTIKKNEKPL